MCGASILAPAVPTPVPRGLRSSARHRRASRGPLIARAMSDAPKPSFVGKWKRQSEESVNAVAYLLAHGATPETAAERALAPYEQEWRATGEEEGEFRVLTDPGTGRGVRSVVYPMGEWEEPFAGKSELFGEEPGTVLRHTTFEEHPERRLDDGGNVMIVERTFTPRMDDGSAGDATSCKERFERVAIFRPMDA